MGTLLGGILFMPIQDALRLALIVSVVLIAVFIQAFFFWSKLQERLMDQIYEKLMLRLYKSDDYIQFLLERQKRKGKSESGS
jgi:hypothetical protein